MLLQMSRTMLADNTKLSEDKINELVNPFINALPPLPKTQIHTAQALNFDN